MHKNYELWLDESGDFEGEEDQNILPSLIGGVLIEMGKIRNDELATFVLDDNHACEIKKNAGETILPALDFVREKGGHLVFFENRDRENRLSNRELYLRVLASGLVQLLMLLSAREGSFTLNVFIALRVDPVARKERGEPQIPDEEYLGKIYEYIQRAIKQQSFALEEGSSLNISIGSARKEYKLMLADFCCNSRITRKSRKFSPEEKVKLDKFYEEEYIFGINEKLSESWIKTYLAEDNVADCLMEIYTSPEKLNKKIIMSLVRTKLQKLSFRIVKAQLAGFLSQLKRYVSMETNFENSEDLLKRIIRELIPELEQAGVYFYEFQFDVNLYLSDMYLREGDVIHAKPVLFETAKAAAHLSGKFEYVLRQYQLIEKQALYDINCFDFEEAHKKMAAVESCMDDMLYLLGDQPLLKQYLGDAMQSEYLGDALCMKLYADMFRQRTVPELYEAMVNDSDKALKQYLFEGELERNQQYRAHIEMESGRYEEALGWLFSTVPVDSKEMKQSACVERYLDRAMEEDYISRSYYLMYFVEIISEAYLHGQEEFADSLYHICAKRKDVWDSLSEEQPAKKLMLEHVETSRISSFMDVLADFTRKSAALLYHPMEIIYWKLATYHALKGNKKTADHWYSRAVSSCSCNKDYSALTVVSLGILSEQLYFAMKSKDNPEKILSKIRKRYQELKTQDIPDSMKRFVKQWESLADGKLQEVDPALPWELSRKITF